MDLYPFQMFIFGACLVFPDLWCANNTTVIIIIIIIIIIIANIFFFFWHFRNKHFIIFSVVTWN